MAEQLMSMEQVCAALQLNQDQIMALVKEGKMRGFRDRNTYKFRRSDIDKYKAAVQAGGTVVLEPGSGVEEGLAGEVTEIQVPAEKTEIQPPVEKDDKSDTSKIDLADVEGEAGAEESDQTSVLAPVEDEEEASGDEVPTFEFSEEDLGLSLDDEAAESVLVADESESSVDILETIEESSSESAATTTDLEMAEEESGSGQEVAAVADVEETPPSEEGVPETVLEADESSDDFETIDLDEISPETAGAEESVGETVELADLEGAEEAGEGAPATETVGAEVEPATVGLPSEEEGTQLTAGGVDTAALEGAEESGTEIGIAEQPAPSEAIPGAVEEAPVVAAGWDLVVPWLPGNILLAAAIIMVFVGGAFVFCEMMGLNNDFTKQVVDFVKQTFPNL